MSDRRTYQLTDNHEGSHREVTHPIIKEITYYTVVLGRRVLSENEGRLRRTPAEVVPDSPTNKSTLCTHTQIIELFILVDGG